MSRLPRPTGADVVRALGKAGLGSFGSKAAITSSSIPTAERPWYPYTRAKPLAPG